jgi:hypothetical protein
MKWPPNETGALLHAPNSKLTGLAEDKSAYSVAQACRHEATLIERPPGHPHHEALRCAHCGVFLRWLPKEKRAPVSCSQSSQVVYRAIARNFRRDKKRSLSGSAQNIWKGPKQ